MFSALQWSTQLLVAAGEANRRERYLCPYAPCGQEVRLRAGTRNAPHFAHTDENPSCPYYISQADIRWDGKNLSGAKRIVFFDDGSCAILTTDSVHRFRISLHRDAEPQGHTPEYEYIPYNPPTASPMVFSHDLCGTRIWSQEAVFAGEYYYAVGRLRDAPPAVELDLGQWPGGWHVWKFKIDLDPDDTLLRWIKMAGLHFRPVRRSWAHGSIDTTTNSVDSHYVRIGRSESWAADVEISASSCEVRLSDELCTITVSEFTRTLINVATPAMYPIPSETQWFEDNLGYPVGVDISFGVLSASPGSETQHQTPRRLIFRIAERNLDLRKPEAMSPVKSKPLTVGTTTEHSCDRCRMPTDWLIEAVIGTRIAKAHCCTCGAERKTIGSIVRVKSDAGQSTWYDRMSFVEPSTFHSLHRRRSRVDDVISHPELGDGYIVSCAPKHTDVLFWSGCWRISS